MPTISEIGLDVDARLDWEENDAVADYKLAVHWKLFANSSLVSEDDLKSTGKRHFINLAGLEITMNKAIDQHLSDMEINHEIVSCGYIAQTAAYCGQSQKSVITDFSTEQMDKVF